MKLYFKGDDRNTRINPQGSTRDGAAFVNDDNDNKGSSFGVEEEKNGGFDRKRSIANTRPNKIKDAMVAFLYE